VAPRIEKFRKRLTEKDPISGDLRYGSSMRGKVAQLGDDFDLIQESLLPSVEEQVVAELRAWQESKGIEDAERRTLEEFEAARKREEDERIKVRKAQQELAQRRKEEAEAQERCRIAEEAAAIRARRAQQAEEESQRQAEDKARREREAGELGGAVVRGPVGVENGLRRLKDALNADPAQYRTTCGALAHVLQNIAANPENPMFSTIKRENVRFHADIGRFEGATQVLLASGFQMEVQEGQTCLIMKEPDMSQDAAGWSEWYTNVKEAVERLRQEVAR
jgi:hypothetical protein